MEQMPSKLHPALIGGAIMGVLSAIPIIAAGNCVCCMWIILGGLMAGHFYSKALPPGVEFKTGDGAIVGLLAGLFGALFSTFLTYVLHSAGLQSMDFLDKIMESNREIPPEVEDWIKDFQAEGGFNTAMAVMMLISSLFVDALFGMLGGILSTKFFKNKKPVHESQTTIL